VYRIPLLACLGTLFLVAPLHTQPIYPPYPNSQAAALVNFWYQHFLHRNADFGAATWVNALQSGQPPAQVLATILSGQEYFLNAGGTQPAFIRALYIDLTGSPPLPVQMQYWLNRSMYTSRRHIAYELLLFYPTAWQLPGSNYPY
jgi:hypothetical protein